MKKFIKYLIILIVLAVAGFFSYDLYMRNSGVVNRVKYEKQKHDIKKKKRPVRDFFRKLVE